MMDLLESVLRTADAEQYIDTFKKNNIEASTLPLLTETDLEIFGVDKANVRKTILEKSSTLQIPHEKKENLTVTRDYVELVLNQISHQLYLHHASLSCALNRKDIVVCDIKLEKATECLLKCINSLEQELDNFERKHGSSKTQKRTRIKKIIIGVGLSTVALVLIGKLAKNYIMIK